MSASFVSVVPKSFLGAFAKLRKENISFFISACPSVYLSVRMPELDSQLTDFYEILHLKIFRKYVEKIQV
jgi:hypothetical protein